MVRNSPIALYVWLLLMAGCAAQPLNTVATVSDFRVTPWAKVIGAPQAQVSAAGAPALLGGPFTRLVAPVAVSASNNDLLVADVGLGRVMHIDLGLNVMRELRGAAARPDTRVYLSSDGVAYVTDSARREVVRYGRNGQLLQRLHDENLLARPVGIAVDERTGRIWVGDGFSQQLVMFHPAGRAAIAVPFYRGGDGPRSISALAVGIDGLYVVDDSCFCVYRMAENGRVLSIIGRGTLKQPVAVASDRSGRIYVLERQENRVVVFSGESIAGYVDAPEGVQMDSIYVDGAMMFIASSSGARIDILRISTASAGRH